MKPLPVLCGLVCLLLLAGPAGAESWSKQLTPEMTSDGMYSFTIKVERLEDADLGEFLKFHVTVKGKDLKELPVRSHELRVFHGREFISSCQVQPTGPDDERTFSFRVAAKYTQKSTFTYAQSGEFDHIGYWFYLQDFAAEPGQPDLSARPAGQISEEVRVVQPARQIPAEIREDWEVAGAELTWEQRPGVDRPFYGPDDPEDFPVFSFGAEARRGRFARLPVPDVPFGVDLYELTDTRGLEELAAMKNLQHLVAGSEGLTDEGLKALAGAAELRSLEIDVFSSPMTGAGLKELAALKNLRELEISGSLPTDRNLRLRGQGELAGLKSLRSLRLVSLDAFDAAFQDIGSLPELRRVELQQVPITDAGLAELARLPKLQSLKISSSEPWPASVTAEGLKSLAAAADLRELVLFNVPMTEEGLKHLATMTGLRALVLYNTPVTNAGLEHLGELTDLQYLVLDNRTSLLTGSGVKHLAGLKDLRTLSLRYAQVGDEAAEVLGRLTELRSLDVAATSLSNTGLMHLAGLTHLEHLDIQGNRGLTVDGMIHLAGMKNLKSLWLGGTQMFGTPERDQQLAGLRNALPNLKIERFGGYLAP